MYDPVNTNHEKFSFSRILERGPEVSEATGYSYWFLGTTLSINHNYNGLLCARYLPADNADSHMDMTDRCKSKNSDRLLRIRQQRPP